MVYILVSRQIKLGMVVFIGLLIIQVSEAGELCIQSQPGLYSEFNVCLSYIARPCLKKEINFKTG